ncbi:MAG: restriction endonuclease subunit M, partial [Spartobacteria bacterium]|nr:restriction endonuclease subunit M [Spartobacteria bacterium]
MALFQHSVVRENAKRLDAAELDARFRVYGGYFLEPGRQAEIRKMKEEEFKPRFLPELFGDCLGYTIRPDEGFNFTVEHKNVDDAKKADAAILDGGKTVGVVEVKGTDTTDLAKAAAQAFGYKNHQPDARYVVVTNFEKLRFYVDNAVAYEEFDLFRLDRAGFERLWLCLAWTSVRDGLPLRLKAASVSAEDQITKRLYADYSAFRTALFADIRARNPRHEPLPLFKKTQKLIDRFLFILFAEDRGLLPANLTAAILAEWQALKKARVATTLYDRFKLYFNDLLEGSPAADIFAYNGGLFRPDDVLDALAISDDVLAAHALKLSNYDFASEVDVDVLGHIFEHSLAEIEEVEAGLSGAAAPEKVSRRKKDGIFYTPKYVTQYIVDNTLGKLCAEKKQELGLDVPEPVEAGNAKKARAKRDARLAACDAYRAWLLELSICDPACGSGAFLNAALDFLMAEHRALDVEKARLHGDALIFSDIENSILERNLYGVDLNEESVEIAKLSLWLRTAQKGRKLSTLTGNVKCGNSLIADPAIAGDKAFDWPREFPAVFAKSGFDVVIGNPPYVFARSLPETTKQYLAKTYETLEYQVDLYVAFMERGVRLLNEGGWISYIVPNPWLKNMRMSSCRSFMLMQFNLTDMIPYLPNVFAEASVDTLIFSGKKSGNDPKIKIWNMDAGNLRLRHSVPKQHITENKGFVFDVEVKEETLPILEKVQAGSQLVGDIFDVVRGVNPYDKATGQSEETIATRAYHATYAKDSTFVPELKGRHIARYATCWDGENYVSYGDWLAAPREPKYFTGERIYLRKIVGTTLFATYVDDATIADQSLYIAKRKNEKFEIKYLLGLLNSRLLTYYFRVKSNEFDDLFPQIKVTEFKELPIKEISPDAQQPFIALADRMLALNAELQAARSNFLSRVRNNVAGVKVTGALERFEELDFAGFLKELKKQKLR